MDEIRIPWPGWRLGSKLGSGSYGNVYEIERSVTGGLEKAAMKVIRLPASEEEIEMLRDNGYDDQSIGARYRVQTEEILQEYGIMAELKGCTSIVHCDDYSVERESDGITQTIYIRMELLTPLIKYLRGQKNPEEIALRLGKDLCRALVACEYQAVVHRDIKPENIFVSQDGFFKLGDFGIARTMEKTMSGTKTGTYNFMAPEVYRGEEYGKRVDIYSLGMVLYWLLNERRGPFLPLPPSTVTLQQESSSRAERFAGKSLPAPAHGSPAFQRLVLKACAFRPEDRFQNAEDMLNQLNMLEGSCGRNGGSSRHERTETGGTEYRTFSGYQSTAGNTDATVGAFGRNAGHGPTERATVKSAPRDAFGDQTMRDVEADKEEQKRRIAEQNAAARAAAEQAQRAAAEQARRAAEAEKIRQQTDPAQKTAEAPKENKQQEPSIFEKEIFEGSVIGRILYYAILASFVGLMLYYFYWSNTGYPDLNGMLGILFEWIHVHGEKAFKCGVLFIGFPWAIYDTFIKPSSKKE